MACTVALSLSVLTGTAPRTGALGALAHNRGVRDLHGFMTALWLPLGIARVAALVADPRAGLSVAGVVVRDTLSHGDWLSFHRLAYPAFAAAFAHGLLSGTDFASPLLAGLAWATALAMEWVGLQRLRRLSASRATG